MIQHYELMFALPGSMEPAKVAELQQQILALLAEHGTITSQYDIQRRKMGYKIKHEQFGYYYVAQFDMEADKVKPVDNKLRLNQDVMRYIIVKAEPQTAEQFKTLLEEKVKPMEPAEKAAIEYPRQIVQDHQFTEADKAKEAVEPVKKADAVSIEELDKKLDAILDDSDLAEKL